MNHFNVDCLLLTYSTLYTVALIYHNRGWRVHLEMVINMIYMNEYEKPRNLMNVN